MTQLSELKLASAHMIYQSKLSNQAKLQLLKFVKESNEHQLMILLLDSKISKPIKDQTVLEIIEQRFKSNNVLQEKIRKTAMSVAGIVSTMGTFGIPALWIIYRFIRSSIDECSSKCGTIRINDLKRQTCMLTCKISNLTKGIQKLKSSPCKGDKNCETKKQKFIKEIETKLNKAKTELEKNKKEMILKGKEEITPDKPRII